MSETPRTDLGNAASNAIARLQRDLTEANRRLKLATDALERMSNWTRNPIARGIAQETLNQINQL